MRPGSRNNPCPYRPGDGLYGYHVLQTHSSNFSHVLICKDAAERRVVLKTPVDPADYGPFRREVEWWRMLSADSGRALHLVRCTAFIKLERKPFAVLEYIDGPNLRALLDREHRKRLSITQALRYGVQFCHGMVAATSQTVSLARKAKGFAHRDICPENVMISCECEPEPGRNLLKINDFGLARRITHDARSGRHARGFAGRPNYSAPEVLVGHRATPASDVYSFGVTLWEMVTGFVPHRINPKESYDDFRWRVVTHRPLLVREYRPEVPETLETLLIDCLRRRRERRFPRFDVVLAEIESVAAEFIGTGRLEGEGWQCGRCAFVPETPPADDLCLLCGAEWQPVPVTP